MCISSRGNYEEKKIKNVLEDVKNLKAELDVLKNTLKSLASIKQEGKVLSKIIKDLTEEVKNLKTSNKDLIDKVKCLEEQFEEEADKESESEEFNSVSSSELPIEQLFTCEDCGCQFGIRKYFNNHIKTH